MGRRTARWDRPKEVHGEIVPSPRRFAAGGACRRGDSSAERLRCSETHYELLDEWRLHDVPVLQRDKPAYAGGSCCVAFYADSGYNYWQTNKMWRPSGSASIYYFNASGVVGYYSSPTDNPLVVHGSYGYSDGFCENDTGSSMSSVTCQDYNWNA